MCNPACLDFVRRALSASDVTGRRVLEVGAYNVNGSVRGQVLALDPAEYIGTDLVDGPGVDEVVDAGELVARFGRDRFDVVVSTEMLEHVVDWRTVIENLKAVLRPGGVLALTTRSPGFGYHAHPIDAWRYTQADMRAILADFDVEMVEPDHTMPGVFVSARKPHPRRPAVDLRTIEVLAVEQPSTA